MLSVCYHALPQCISLLRSGDDPLVKHSDNCQKAEQVKCQTHKLVCLMFVLLSKALENNGKTYMSYVVAKVSLMNAQETCGMVSADFLEIIKKYAAFSYSKVRCV